MLIHVERSIHATEAGISPWAVVNTMYICAVRAHYPSSDGRERCVVLLLAEESWIVFTDSIPSEYRPMGSGRSTQPAIVPEEE